MTVTPLLVSIRQHTCADGSWLTVTEWCGVKQVGPSTYQATTPDTCAALGDVFGFNGPLVPQSGDCITMLP